MGILSRYVFWSFLKLFFPIWIGLCLLIFIVEWMTGAFASSASVGVTTALYFFKIPSYMQLVYPVAVLFSSLLCLGKMNRGRESVAAQSFGYSLWKITTPILFALGLISIPYYFINTQVAPESLKLHYEIYDTQVKKRASRFAQNKNENLWYKNSSTFYKIGYINQDKKLIFDLILSEIDSDSKIIEQIYAESALYKNKKWILRNGRIYTPKNNKNKVFVDFKRRVETRIAPILDLRQFNFEPELLNQKELTQTIHRYKKLGIKNASFKVAKEARLSILLLAFVFALLSFPRSLHFRRKSNAAADIAYVSILCFSYWLVYNYCINLGATEKIPVFAAAWGPSLCLLSFALYKIFQFSRRRT